MTSEMQLTKPGNLISLETLAANLNAKLEFCKLLMESGFVNPTKFKTRASVLACILYGEELGFAPMASLRIVNFIKETPSLSAAALQALAVKHGGLFKVLQSDNNICTIDARRNNGWEETFSYSFDDAKRAQLVDKDNWKKGPRDMLYARCSSALVRRGWPDVIQGIYSTEEMQDAPSETPKPLLVEGYHPDDLRNVRAEKYGETPTYKVQNSELAPKVKGDLRSPTAEDHRELRQQYDSFIQQQHDSFSHPIINREILEALEPVMQPRELDEHEKRSSKEIFIGIGTPREVGLSQINRDEYEEKIKSLGDQDTIPQPREGGDYIFKTGRYKKKTIQEAIIGDGSPQVFDTFMSWVQTNGPDGTKQIPQEDIEAINKFLKA